MIFLQHHVAKLPWPSLTTIIEQVKDMEQRNWYIIESIKNGWARPVIVHQISLKLYERKALLENKTTNFDEILPASNNEQVKELLKNPYIFDFITADKDLKELDIEQELTTNITKLLLELGNGFSPIFLIYYYITLSFKIITFTKLLEHS